MTIFSIAIIFSLFLPSVCFAFKPVARWDVVPYQRIKYGSSMKIGVIAFSKPGINRVVITPSGQGYSGGAKTVTAMTLNDRTGVYEYWTTLSAGEFTGNGAITVSAVVYDNDNNSRSLSLSLIVEGASAYSPKVAWVDATRGNDSTGTVGNQSAPYRTIGAAVAAAQTANGGSSNGNIIYLQEGTYSVSGVSANTSSEWLTITKSATADRSKVIINTGQLRTGYLKYDSVTLQSRGSGLWVATEASTRLWTNNCRKIGSGRWVSGSNPVSYSDFDNHYSTNTFTYNVDYAYNRMALVRGAEIVSIGNDAFENTPFIVNTTLTDSSNGPTTWHNDAFQIHTTGTPPPDNRIVYNYKATDLGYEGFFMRSDAGQATDNAFVNVLVEMREPPDESEQGVVFSPLMMNQGTWDHLIIWNCTFTLGTSSLNATHTNSSIVGNVFWQFLHEGTAVGDPNPAHSEPGNTNGNEYLYNHYMYVYGQGSFCTGYEGYPSNWPCPQWYAKRPDSHPTGSATIGGGVIDLKDPSLASFGAPVANSVLIDRIPFVKVPADLYGNPRIGKSDIGAIEASFSESPPDAISVPADFQLK
ncbi:MAG TPA: hypothetical protein ENN61_05830 [Bacteroidaceae bacterium]|nr:hypothetical protein [Bacteroidaceae bacterium]